MNEFAEDTALIRALVAYANSNPAAVAKRAGVAVSTVNRPYNGTAGNRLGRSVLEKLQAAFPDFPGWTGNKLSDRRLSFRGAPPESEADLVEVVVSDIAYGLGGSYIDEASAETTVERFPRAFIRQFTKGPLDDLYFASGVGDSMEPTIHSSDLVLIDRSQELLRVSDQIWAAAIGEISMVKRIRILPGGDVLLVSDKPEVSDYLVAKDELQLIGRVVGVAKKL